MQEKQGKKLLIIYILNILNKYSDENHRLSQSDIISRLKNDYGMDINRKSIKPNILELIDAGYDINYSQRQKNNGDVVLTDYYINRIFTDEELRIVIDGLLFSKYIPGKQRERLIEKLEGLSNVYFKYKTKHIRNIAESRPENKEIFYSISILDEAIDKKLCVKFAYTDYGTDKKLKTRKTKEGKVKRYVVSPYEMAVTNGRYYLIGNYKGYDNISYYRIDRIKSIELTDEPAVDANTINGCEKGFDLPKHMAEHIYMFAGKGGMVEFKVLKTAINHIFDWFGTDVSFSNEDDEWVKVSVKVNYEAMRYWAMQYSNYVKVIYPESLVDEIKDDIVKAAARYNVEVE